MPQDSRNGPKFDCYYRLQGCKEKVYQKGGMCSLCWVSNGKGEILAIREARLLTQCPTQALGGVSVR